MDDLFVEFNLCQFEDLCSLFSLWFYFCSDDKLIIVLITISMLRVPFRNIISILGHILPFACIICLQILKKCISIHVCSELEKRPIMQICASCINLEVCNFLDACYVTLHPALSVPRAVGWSVRRLVGWSPFYFFGVFKLFGFTAHFRMPF